jgi:hypothetical protein
MFGDCATKFVVDVGGKRMRGEDAAGPAAKAARVEVRCSHALLKHVESRRPKTWRGVSAQPPR